MTDSTTVVHNAHKVVVALGDTSSEDLANACVMLLLFAYDKGINPKLMTFEQFSEEVQFNMLENRKKQIEQGGDGLFVGIAEDPGWEH